MSWWVTVFWASLSFVFLVMAFFSYRLRQKVPGVLSESERKQWVAGPSPSDLRPIFSEMLTLETTALAMTAAAALVSAVGG